MKKNDVAATDHQFWSGGGEMGKLIRAKDWSKTPLGAPETWPQCLRTMVSVMLNNPFGMYIAWGTEYTQIYNDGYRPILGSTKHPQALGISTRETFAEIWHIIESMFEGVMNGVAVGFPDFMLPLDRNGFVENCYFDFAYSPIKMENGEVGGVLVTVIETTNKKKAEDELIESKKELEFVIEAAQLGTFDLNPQTNKFSGNARLKQWFGLPPQEQIALEDAMNAIAESDREKVTAAIEKALQFSSGGVFDVEYSIINPISKKETVVHAKGKAWFDDKKVAYRMNGTLEDVTEQTMATRKRIETEQHIRTMVLKSPVGICVLDAKTLVSEIVNESFIEIAGKPKEAIVGKFYWETFAEARMYYEAALNNVVESGEPYFANEVELMLIRHGKEEIIYVTFVYAPLKDDRGNVIKVAVWVLENTTQVEARKKIMVSETNLRLMILQAPIAIAILRGTEYRLEIANKYALELWGRTEEQVLNREIFESMPELLSQGIKELLDDVWTTGIRFATEELAVQLLRKGQMETVYVNFSYEPIYNAAGEIDGIMAIGFDVTSHVTSRQKAEQSEQRIRALVESAPFPIGVYEGEEMRIVLANQSIMDIWGKGNDVVGKLFTEILPELVNQQIFEQVREVFKTGIPFHAKNQQVDLVKDGTLKPYYFNYSFTPLFNAAGNVFAVMNTAAEVTELHEAKQKVDMALSEIKLFKFMADTAADPFILMNSEGRFVYLNKVAQKKWGYTPDETKQLSVPDVDTIYDAEKFQEVFQRSIRETVPPFETLHKNKQGVVYPVEINMVSVQQDGKPLLFAIARDITERKKSERAIIDAFHKIEESERRFRDSVQQAPLGIAIFRGPDYVVELANEAYLTIIDRKPGEFIGHPIFDALPEIKDFVEPLFADVVATGSPFFGNEFPATLNRMGKRDPAFFNFVYHPLKEEDGSISGIMVVATEVTATVKAKHLLEEREKHFRFMVMQSPIPMTILRGSGFVIESANKVMFESIWRKKETEIVGKPILEVFPELNDQKYPELLKSVFTTGKSHTEKESIAYVQGDDGMKKFYLDFEYAPLFEPDGKVSGIMITVNDVTDKVEARQKVEEAEERSRLAAEATELATWELDLDTREMIHSPRLGEIYGYDSSKHLSQTELRAQILTDDRINIVEKAFDMAMEEGVYFFEARMIRTDGSLRWIRLQGKTIYNQDKEPIKMVGTLRDITEEKQLHQELLEREQKFRLLADSMPQHIWTSDPEGNLNYFNQSLFDYTGLTAEQIYKDGWLQFVHPDERKENTRIWMESVLTGKDFLFEHRFRRYDGEYRWQLSRAIPQRNEDGIIQMWVGSSTDIQNIKEQEQQKDYFISMASHELKTPLTSIKGYVQILQTMHTGGSDAFLQNALNTIDRQIITLTKLISELLDISKIKSGGLDLNKEYFEMADLVNEVVTEIKHINPNYEISLETEENAKVFADRDRISQVLINLLTNAVKYSPQSKIIKVNCRLKSKSIHVSIQDFGIGISKNEQDKVFERFYRVEGKNEKTFPGFGIGLFIASEIIKKHNGTIGLESEPGRGSIFYIDLPVV